MRSCGGSFGIGSDARPEGARPAVSAATAHVLAWTLVLWVDVVAVAIQPKPGGGWGARVLHLGFDVGHVALVGVVGAALALGFDRWVSSRRVFAELARAAFALPLGALALAPDLRGFAERKGQVDRLWLLALGVALVLPLAGLLGAVLARRFWRIGALCLALAALVAHHRVLPSDYPGVHLVMVFGAATLATSALVGAELPRPLCLRPRVQAALALVATLWGTLSVAVWPPPSVIIEAFQVPGTFLFPFLARAHASRARGVEVTREVAARFLPNAALVRREGRAVLVASQPRLAPPRPIVIFVSIDALRADALSNRASAAKLPHLSALARQSVSFTEARVPGSSTRNSLGAIFASKLACQLRWKYHAGYGRNLSEDPSPRIPDLMRSAGLSTLQLVTYPPLGGGGRVLGRFDHERVLAPGRPGQRHPLAEQVVDALLEELDARKDQPLFVFSHWMDPHAPYDASPVQGSERERWLGEVELADRELGRLSAELTRRGLSERVVLVVSSDHGEALGEHGIPNHGVSLYDSLVRVPLMIRVPGVEPRSVEQPVSLLDLGPTLGDLLGVDTPGEMMGQSLVPYLRGQSPAVTRAIAADQVDVRMLVLGRYKVMADRRKGTQEIYDLESDPRELKNLVGLLAGEEALLLGTLAVFFDVHATGTSLPDARE